MYELVIQRQLVSQFQAALAMLSKAVDCCPEDLWTGSDPVNRFWHVAYHAVFYTHFYLQTGEPDFRPWLKYQQDSQYLGSRHRESDDPILVQRPYSRDEVLEYLEFCSAEVTARVPALDLSGNSGFSWLPFNRFEVHLYNLRHLQHHTGQLADRLRSHADVGVPWVRMG